MEADNQSQPSKPTNYKQMVYAPAKKIESEDDLAKLEQTKLEHSYTYWVKIQESLMQKKKRDGKFEDELKEIETISSVSTY